MTDDQRNESAIDYFTPEEAREKWCPFPGSGGTSYQTDNCLADVCMLWRWELKFVLSDSDTVPTIQKRTGRGYCGGGK